MGIFINRCIACTFLLAVFFRAADYIRFARLRNDAKNIAVSEHETAKLLRRRFSDCISLGKSIRSTPVYIQKTLYTVYHINDCGSVLSRISLLCMCVCCLMLWTAFIYGSAPADELLFKGILSFFSYYIVAHLLNVRAAIQDFIIMTSDYLDNTLRSRCSDARRSRSRSASFSGCADNSSAAVDAEIAAGSNISIDSCCPARTKSDISAGKPDTHALSDGSTADADSELIASVIDEFIL